MAWAGRLRECGIMSPLGGAGKAQCGPGGEDPPPSCARAAMVRRGFSWCSSALSFHEDRQQRSNSLILLALQPGEYGSACWRTASAGAQSMSLRHRHARADERPAADKRPCRPARTALLHNTSRQIQL